MRPYVSTSPVTDKARLEQYLGGSDHRALAHVLFSLAKFWGATIHVVSEYRGITLDGEENEVLRCVTLLRESGRVLRLERRLAAGGWAGDWEVT